MPPLSLYIHIPWCIKKCPYCDFNSHALNKKETLPELAYIQALLNDLQSDIERYNITRPLHSIFIGGGTPSLFSPQAIAHLMNGIAKQLHFETNIEITLEANPSTFESHKFAEFNALGINRLSIGVQSFNDDLLKKLGRVHSSQEAITAIKMAKQVGFENFNIDLMFALPDESSAINSVNDVKTAINLEPNHISLYQLTIEENTHFYKRPPHLPNENVIMDTQMQCQALLAENQYYHYEVSAYSRLTKQCRHNLNYWQFGDYLGIGAGAHGKISLNLPNTIYRTFKTKSPELYLKALSQNNTAELIAVNDLPLEFMMNHLRLKEGFNLQTYYERTGLPLNSLEPHLSECVQQKLFMVENNRYYCSLQAWNFLDSILEKFIA